MIVEAKKMTNGFFIPMLDELKKIDKKQFLIKIQIVDYQADQLESKHKLGYLSKKLT